MTAQSALVIKARVISVERADIAKDFPLKSVFWQVYRAKLQVISSLKGAPGTGTMDFFYRADVPPAGKPAMWLDAGPENHAHFKLEPGHSYILFVQRQAAGSPFMQLSGGYTLRPWEGFFRAASAAPIAAGTPPEQAVFSELKDQIGSKQTDVARYAALTLLDLSCEQNNGSTGTTDFARQKVLNAIFGDRHEPPAALCTDDFLKTFIESVGSMSPYSRDDFRMRYLWTRASKPMCNWAPWSTADNITASPAIPFLIKIADGKHKADTCAAAILAMGLCQSDSKIAQTLEDRLPDWLSSPAPEKRAAAIILSADYKGQGSAQKRISAMQDATPQVRKAAALSAGLAQCEAAIPALAKLLRDSDPGVRAWAALSLVSLPVEKTKPVLLAHLDNHDFGVGFLCRLALSEPLSVRSQLLAECQKKVTSGSAVPTTDAQMVFQNGLATDPHALALRALLKYLDDCAGAELSKPDFARFLDCMEQNAVGDPSLTGAVFEMLITHGLDRRAASFKKRAIAAQPTLPAIAFEQPERLLKAGELKRK